MTPSLLERVLWRDRLVISVVLVALTVVSWAQMVVPDDVPSGAERLLPCCGARFGVAFAMWVVMMAGMMIPSVAPMVLTHAKIMRRRSAQGAPFVSSALFLAGYLVAWTGFSAVAALAQWLLYRSGLLDGRTLAISPWAGCAVLLAVGVFQLSPAKNACRRAAPRSSATRTPDTTGRCAANADSPPTSHTARDRAVGAPPAASATPQEWHEVLFDLGEISPEARPLAACA